jgi:hypothetical protein
MDPPTRIRRRRPSRPQQAQQRRRALAGPLHRPVTWQIRDQAGLLSTIDLLTEVHRTATAAFPDGADTPPTPPPPTGDTAGRPGPFGPASRASPLCNNRSERTPLEWTSTTRSAGSLSTCLLARTVECTGHPVPPRHDASMARKARSGDLASRRTKHSPGNTTRRDSFTTDGCGGLSAAVFSAPGLDAVKCAVSHCPTAIVHRFVSRSAGFPRGQHAGSRRQHGGQVRNAGLTGRNGPLLRPLGNRLRLLADGSRQPLTHPGRDPLRKAADDHQFRR